MERNPFLALAKALWARGDDSEIIASELAHALMHIIKEGTKADPAFEFIRLTTPIEPK